MAVDELGPGWLADRLVGNGPAFFPPGAGDAGGESPGLVGRSPPGKLHGQHVEVFGYRRLDFLACPGFAYVPAGQNSGSRDSRIFHQLPEPRHLVSQ